MKGVNMFIADGFEDMEVVATRDVLVRGGVDVRLVGIGEEPFAVSAHGVTIGVDCSLEELIDEDYDGQDTTKDDVMIFPGGMPGTKNLAGCKTLIDIMNTHYNEGGTVAAICAAPGFVLGQLEGIGKAEFTCYDGCGDLAISKGAKFSPESVIVSGRIITGRGPGYAIDFGLAILKALKGGETASEVEYGLMLRKA